jgi:hypothetical protein
MTSDLLVSKRPPGRTTNEARIGPRRGITEPVQAGLRVCVCVCVCVCSVSTMAVLLGMRASTVNHVFIDLMFI